MLTAQGSHAVIEPLHNLYFIGMSTKMKATNRKTKCTVSLNLVGKGLEEDSR